MFWKVKNLETAEGNRGWWNNIGDKCINYHNYQKSWEQLHRRNYKFSYTCNTILGLCSNVQQSKYFWLGTASLRNEAELFYKSQIPRRWTCNKIILYVLMYTFKYKCFSFGYNIVLVLMCNMKVLNHKKFWCVVVIIITLAYYYLYCGAGVAQSVQYLYTLDNQAIRVRSLAEAKNFFSSLCVQTSNEAHPSSYPKGTGDPFSRGKVWPGHDANHSSPSSAKVKNEKLLFPLPLVTCMVVAGLLYFTLLHFTICTVLWKTNW
jgi:hypothetical protein